MPTQAEWTSAGLEFQKKIEEAERRRKEEEHQFQERIIRDAAAIKERERQLRLEKEAIRLAWKQLQKQCKHPNETYHPDPSGNSDSYYECDLCGRCS